MSRRGDGFRVESSDPMKPFFFRKIKEIMSARFELEAKCTNANVKKRGSLYDDWRRLTRSPVRRLPTNFKFI